MPYAIEEIARSAIKVQSVDPTDSLNLLDETPLRKLDKKRSSATKKGGKSKKDEDKDLDYHTSFKRFQESLASINQYALKKMKRLDAAHSPVKAGKSNVSAEKDKGTAERARENAGSRSSVRPGAPSQLVTSANRDFNEERVYYDPLATVSAFLDMGCPLDCLNPLSKELNSRMVDNMFFGRCFLGHYYS